MITLTLTSDEAAEMLVAMRSRIRLHGFGYGKHKDGSYKINPLCEAILSKLESATKEASADFVDSKPIHYKSGSNL